MSLLLAFLPVEGLSFSVQDPDTCSTCRCCVQTNTNPAPTRNAPAAASKTVRIDREARLESQPFSPPAARSLDAPVVAFDAPLLRTASVPLFERHCSLLI